MKIKLFFGSMVGTFFLLVALLVLGRFRDDAAARRLEPELKQISDGIFVTSQLQTLDILRLKSQGYKTIIDFRPDGEAADQPPSSEFDATAKENGMGFFYIPVPHETIPDSAVVALLDALKQMSRPAVLYCRTGRRAVRTFALAEASRDDGPALSGIYRMVHDAGFNADDLADNIKHRIESRRPFQTAKH